MGLKSSNYTDDKTSGVPDMFSLSAELCVSECGTDNGNENCYANKNSPEEYDGTDYGNGNCYANINSPDIDLDNEEVIFMWTLRI